DQAIPNGGQRVPTPAASDDSTHKCLDQKQRIQPKYLPNIIKSCCILHNFLIDAGETDLQAEIQAWRKEVKRLKDQDFFVDYGDPEQAEGEPREELHSPEDVKECSNALFLSANPRVFFHLNLRHVRMQKSL
ncbi:hypothetical protein SELMODRAFT_431821, partial [Selaginella moellendorffii]